MRGHAYYTLAALLDGPLHGYGIIKRGEELSRGEVRLTAGTLYATLDRLVERGLVAEAGREIVDGRARRYYELTDAGHADLQAEAERLERAAAVVREHVSVSHPVVRTT